ncbi:MAG: helix-turn-helix domain-containing protein [Christensenellaceae bacterium]|jgi:carbohydrate diacid regulator|nr:helix-turn-helix domain-containing protein [Christensenellaceae bacterium]
MDNTNCLIGDKNSCLLCEFFNAIPKDIYENNLKKFDTPAIKRILLMPDERRTVEVFLHNNLNINAAAKELYMHRNTLIYRLEKIKTSTGLDLKKFCDAFVFHVLMFRKPN